MISAAEGRQVLIVISNCHQKQNILLPANNCTNLRTFWFGGIYYIISTEDFLTSCLRQLEPQIFVYFMWIFAGEKRRTTLMICLVDVQIFGVRVSEAVFLANIRFSRAIGRNAGHRRQWNNDRRAGRNRIWVSFRSFVPLIKQTRRRGTE